MDDELVIELCDYAEMLEAIPEELYPKEMKTQMVIRLLIRRFEYKLYPGEYPPNWATTQEIYKC